jgi:hypothetical protein
MQALNIDSNLPKIRMIERILSHDTQRICAEHRFNGERRFAAIEACAQLCGLHARRQQDFGCHAFLLAITAVAPLPPEIVTGMGRFEARLKGRTKSAQAYAVEMQLENVPVIRITLTIGLKAYDDRFLEEALRPHYQRLFSMLISNGGA